MMKNSLLTTSFLFVIGVSAMPLTVSACGGDVDMTVPHIHDENGFMIAIKQANNQPLKHIDINQIFAGELANHDSHDSHQHHDHNLHHEHNHHHDEQQVNHLHAPE
ncbi:hypothetical protein [Shewanella goraebulensis]|uniref:hypothetical protein n=2 Tax=Shewanella TaxID=22 RepID=UPI00254FBA9A|nr:hypothetical protein [Shewanella goraebulensis]